MQTVQLIPVSEWVYDLYKVEYWTENAADGGRLISTIYLAAASENHMWSDANEYAPHDCNCISFEVVKENVGQPRVIGSMHGQKIYEDGRTHARYVMGR